MGTTHRLGHLLSPTPEQGRTPGHNLSLPFSLSRKKAATSISLRLANTFVHSSSSQVSAGHGAHVYDLSPDVEMRD